MLAQSRKVTACEVSVCAANTQGDDLTAMIFNQACNVLPGEKTGNTKTPAEVLLKAGDTNCPARSDGWTVWDILMKTN